MRNNPNLERAAEELHLIYKQPKYYAALRLSGMSVLHPSIAKEGTQRDSDVMLHSPEPFDTVTEAVDWAIKNDLDNGGSLSKWSSIA